VSSFRSSLSPFLAAQFAIAAATQLLDPRDAKAFLDGELDICLANPGSDKRTADPVQPPLLLRLEIGRVLVKAGEARTAKDVLDLVEPQLQGFFRTELHAKFYQLAMEYSKAKGQASLYFKNALVFLGYVDLNSLSREEKIALSSDLALAALLGEDVYNFGELLQHPILASLQEAGLDWLLEMLKAFNLGEISKFEELFGKFSHLQEALARNQQFLLQKVRTLALVEMVFRRPSNDRSISFADIAEACQIGIREVEIVMMKSMALNLIKGQIDQVAETVHVTWVHPRVLETSQIENLLAKIDVWTENVKNAVQYLENSAPDFFSRELLA